MAGRFYEKYLEIKYKIYRGKPLYVYIVSKEIEQKTEKRSGCSGIRIFIFLPLCEPLDTFDIRQRQLRKKQTQGYRIQAQVFFLFFFCFLFTKLRLRHFSPGHFMVIQHTYNNNKNQHFIVVARQKKKKRQVIIFFYSSCLLLYLYIYIYDIKLK